MSPPSLALIHGGALLGKNSSECEGALHSASRSGGANGPKRHRRLMEATLVDPPCEGEYTWLDVRTRR
jgi:16S rRNA C967 or C1407 C5-methylase (RsmB/RsmF family)